MKLFFCQNVPFAFTISNQSHSFAQQPLFIQEGFCGRARRGCMDQARNLWQQEYWTKKARILACPRPVQQTRSRWFCPPWRQPPLWTRTQLWSTPGPTARQTQQVTVKFYSFASIHPLLNYMHSVAADSLVFKKSQQGNPLQPSSNCCHCRGTWRSGPDLVSFRPDKTCCYALSFVYTFLALVAACNNQSLFFLRGRLMFFTSVMMFLEKTLVS